MDKRFTILSIEDNKADFTLLAKALNRIEGLSLDIINIDNGQNAVDFLFKKKEYKSAPTPNIIMLDINLPAINGKEILKLLKNDKCFRTIPVIIFSTSDYYSDIEEAYKLHANSYITKTFDIQDLYAKVKSIGEYWLKTNRLPDNNNFCFVQNKEEDDK